jgi:hypothetical protein
MLRERERGRDLRASVAEWPDARTPMWDAEGVEAWAQRKDAPAQPEG